MNDQHEALHSASIAIALWDDFVADTDFVLQHPYMRDLAETASSAMNDVYQAIGAHDETEREA